ncbi:hypothetical protein MRX96_046905 [Rhipicephalus microplus]
MLLTSVLNFGDDAIRHPKPHIYPPGVSFRPRTTVHRHKFISQSILTKIGKHHKHADITSENLLATVACVRLRPDIVLIVKDKIFILDLSIAWDARMEALEAMSEESSRSSSSEET